ncbi:hypothetical protein scyTo_0025944, partial [Scyliorhinus torazame]|nr:hypothetical protein [Scyliorhinus torazame]
ANELQMEAIPVVHKDMFNVRSISEQVKELIDKSMVYYSIILNMIGKKVQVL